MQATYDFVDGAICGQGLESVSAEACKVAVDALGITYNKESMHGKWTHTPLGCFVHKGCTQSCRLHFGTGYGNNTGRFRALCNVHRHPQRRQLMILCAGAGPPPHADPYAPRP